jgi:two-component system response regulator (stage 0 sporulation protein F)
MPKKNERAGKAGRELRPKRPVAFAQNELPKILIVDDQLGMRILLTELFNSAGYNAVSVSNGQEAVECFELYRPDLVIMDIRMPVTDGVAALRQMKLLDQHAKVIMMTAYGELEAVSECIRLGAYKHITKPFDIDELIGLVKSALA